MWLFDHPEAEAGAGPPAPRRDEGGAVLTVFMEGTASTIDRVVTQIGLFSSICRAEPLSTSGPESPARRGHFKLSFSGCGVTDGLRGTLFAHGLRGQCRAVRAHVDAFLAAGLRLVLNFVGLSRGGIGGCYLAQLLADLDRRDVAINMLLFDPVPGNLVCMARGDLLGLMNANMAMDLSRVKNLGRVVVLYPHEPLPDLAFHAPLFVAFASDGVLELEQDVILGCHQGALMLHPGSAANCLSFALIRRFLSECGTKLDRGQGRAMQLDKPDAALAKMLDLELDRSQPTTRCAHAQVPGMRIVRHEAGQCLNRSHQRLLRKLGRPSSSSRPWAPQYMLDFGTPTGAQRWCGTC